MSTHNIGFYEKLSKIIVNYHQTPTLYVPLKLSFNFTSNENLSYATGIFPEVPSLRKILSQIPILKRFYM